VGVGSVLFIDAAAEANCLVLDVSAGPVKVVLVGDSELGEELAHISTLALSGNTEVEVFVVEVELADEGHFVLLVF